MAHRTRLSAIALLPNSLGAVQFEKGRARPTRTGDLARNFGEAAVSDPVVFETRFGRCDLMCFPTPLANQAGAGFDSGPTPGFGRPFRLFKALGNAAEFGECRWLEATVRVFLNSVGEKRD